MELANAYSVKFLRTSSSISKAAKLAMEDNKQPLFQLSEDVAKLT